MSALWREAAPAESERRLRPIEIADLDALLAIENACYAFPWSRGNFLDSLAAGYLMQGLCVAGSPALRGYLVAMPGVEEMHLLNLTVAPADQGRGHARFMLDSLVSQCVERGARTLWLEVRSGNARALSIYRRYGFVEAGVRKGYYPAPHHRREDALVMNLAIEGAPEGRDGVV